MSVMAKRKQVSEREGEEGGPEGVSIGSCPAISFPCPWANSLASLSLSFLVGEMHTGLVSWTGLRLVSVMNVGALAWNQDSIDARHSSYPLLG